jgi:N-acetylglucosamine kinase-like BadF-type ATPase
VILLGVDAGGSHTRAVAVDGNGNLKAVAQAGCGNYQIIGLDRLEVLIAELVEKLGVSADHLGLGLAGAGRVTERESIHERIRERFGFRSTVVATDAQVALTAAHAGAAGVIAISGTGSIVLGRDTQGRERRAGGWGSILGDDGSGHDIGLAALRAVLASRDGSGATTTLSKSLLGAVNVTDWEQLIPAVQGSEISREEIAALSPVVFAAAKQGDAVAGEIVEDAGSALGKQVAAVVRSLEISGSVPLACVGGVFHEIGLLWPHLTAAVGRAGAAVHLCDPLLPPVLGAVLLVAAAVPRLDPISMIETLKRLGKQTEHGFE